MGKVISKIILLTIIFMLSGCKKISISELELDSKCEIMIREGKDKKYGLITNEIVHSNILNLLIDTLSGKKIEVPKGGEVYYTNEKQVQIDINSHKKLNIYFGYYLNDTRLDYVGEPCITIVDGENEENYYLINELYSYVCFLINHNTNTIEATVCRVIKNQIVIVIDDDLDASLLINYDELPKEIEVGANVEIKLAKANKDKKGLWIESICLKKPNTER